MNIIKVATLFYLIGQQAKDELNPRFGGFDRSGVCSHGFICRNVPYFLLLHFSGNPFATAKYHSTPK